MRLPITELFAVDLWRPKIPTVQQDLPLQELAEITLREDDDDLGLLHDLQMHEIQEWLRDIHRRAHLGDQNHLNQELPRT